jgi:hypothetical protein
MGAVIASIGEVELRICNSGEERKLDGLFTIFIQTMYVIAPEYIR